MSTVNCGCGDRTPTPVQEFQNRRYGMGRRVYTVDAKGNGHCTCCGRVHYGIIKEIPKKKKGGGSGGGAKSFIAIPPPEGWPGGLPENNGYKAIN